MIGNCRQRKVGKLLQRNIVQWLRNYFCYGNTSMRSVYIVGDLHECINNISAPSVAIESQTKCSFWTINTLLSKMYRHLGWYVKCPIFVVISTYFGYAKQLIVKVHEICSVGAALIHADRQTDRQTQEDQRTERHRRTDRGTVRHNKPKRRFLLFILYLNSRLCVPPSSTEDTGVSVLSNYTKRFAMFLWHSRIWML
jgi:hypothetical protein